jgi:hypothetical protein
MYAMYGRNKYCDCCYKVLVVPAFVCFYSLSFVTVFILRDINIHRGM